MNQLSFDIAPVRRTPPRTSYGASIVTRWGGYSSVIVKARFGDRMGDWAMREIRLIHRLQPRLNCVGAARQRGSK